MKLKLTSSRPLLTVIDGEKRVIDVTYQGLAGRIAALPVDPDVSPIVISGDRTAPDVWNAWKEGFEVENTSSAKRVAEHLLACGAAVAV